MYTLEDIQKVVDQIVEQFQPDKVILFGSYAYGEPTENSDVDLLVIMPFEGRGFEKAVEVKRAVNIPFPCDLLLKTPEEVSKRYQEYDPIMRSAINKGIVLYERYRQRVA
jgi:uncharacterized protein